MARKRKKKPKQDAGAAPLPPAATAEPPKHTSPARTAEPPKHASPAPKAEPGQVTSGGRARRRRAAFLLLAVSLVCVVGLVAVSRRASPVSFAQGVFLESATVPRQVQRDGKIPLTLRFHVSRPIAADEWIFVHLDSEGSGTDVTHRSADARPKPPSSAWGDQDIEHVVDVPLEGSKPGRYRIYTGLYDKTTGARLPVLDPPSTDNRVLAAWVDVVAADADGSQHTFTTDEIYAETRLIAPWRPWLAGIAAAAAIAVWIFLRRRAEQGGAVVDDAEVADDRLGRIVRRIVFAAPAIPFAFGILVVLEFIKDDAYISFRYAHNLVTGSGLVFNHGERVEGFTNFLWVLAMAPFEALGWDLFQVCEVLGSALGIACLVLVGRMTAWIHGERRTLSFLWGSLWLASSASFVLWAKSGLEQPLASLLPIAGAYVLWRARGQPGKERAHLAAGLLLGAGCMTRPELHLMAILVGLPLVVDAVRARRVTRAQWLYVAGILAVTVPCHAFRLVYYGSLVPNTFYAKTGGGWLVWRQGIQTVAEMFSFNQTGLLAVVAPLAFANRRRLLEKATMAVIAVAFMAYYASVGVDEMQWHRLYLPALPFLCVLAALGAQNLLDAAVHVVERGTEKPAVQLLASAVGWAAFLVASGANFAFTFRELNGFNGHGDLAGTFHPDLGKFLVRHERPGGLVAFQDMGSTPYHAPDIDFLDFVGLVDRTVARARHDMGLHAFTSSGANEDARARYESAMRDYFFARNPEWAILTIYTPVGQEKAVSEEFDKDPTGAAFGEAYRSNGFQWGLWDDPRFRERYVPVHTWPRSAAYYLALWRRRDLWVQTPREVVLDAVPPGLGGVRAKLEGGLELLGSETTHQTHERHEAFVTTWWRLPGPMPPDLYFFVHLTRAGAQVPSDHVPGDWMWPADRWKEGQILEDRTLVQLPPFEIVPGTYQVFLGAYRRSTGQRLKIVEGPSDGEDRVPLGTLEVTRLWPLVHQLIPPTRLDVMRKYPERIVDSHR
jgi:hypothetical protein